MHSNHSLLHFNHNAYLNWEEESVVPPRPLRQMVSSVLPDGLGYALGSHKARGHVGGPVRFVTPQAPPFVPPMRARQARPARAARAIPAQETPEWGARTKPGRVRHSGWLGGVAGTWREPESGRGGKTKREPAEPSPLPGGFRA